jgi:cytochrome c oxidase assembly factor CtaG
MCFFGFFCFVVGVVCCVGAVYIAKSVVEKQAGRSWGVIAVVAWLGI